MHQMIQTVALADLHYLQAKIDDHGASRSSAASKACPTG